MSWRLMIEVKHPSFMPPSSLEINKKKNSRSVVFFTRAPHNSAIQAKYVLINTNSRNYEGIAYGYVLDLLLIWRQSHASYPTSSRYKIKNVLVNSAMIVNRLSTLIIPTIVHVTIHSYAMQPHLTQEFILSLNKSLLSCLDVI